MAEIADGRVARGLHPVHAVLLAGAIPLFLGALLSDLAYGSTYHVQWKNFASWLAAGGPVYVGLALVWAIVDALRADVRADRARWLYPFLLLATFVLGFINALIHARDGWASMPAGSIFSFIVLALAIAAAWAGFSSHRVPR